MIQTALNETPLRQLGSRGDSTFRMSLEVMSGIKPTRAMFAHDPNGRRAALGEQNRKDMGPAIAGY